MMPTFSPYVDGFYDVADQLPHWLRQEAERALARQLAEKAAVTTVAQFEARRARVRAHFLSAIGGLPETDAPLNAKCTGVIEQQGYTIEKLIYESLPNFYVTAALYLPQGLSAPAPAVIFVHGHFDLGKAAPEYQAVCIDLVRNGFVVLAVDPPGQGERKQYYDPRSGELTIPYCTTEHTHSGLQFVVGGASIARHFIGDVMRGIDYLESRREVDAARIGITGNSGGGTQTSFLMIAEPRLATAVPCTFITTLESYMKAGQPQDSEQIVKGCFVDGPDHDDYLTMMAPKPVLVGAAAYDFFPLEGTLEAVRRAREIYRLYNADEKLDTAIAATGHAYSPHLRAAAINWFRVHLQGKEPTFRTGHVTTLPEEQLRCTPKGQLLDLYPDSRTIFDLNCARLEEQEQSRTRLQNEDEFVTHVQQMRDAIPAVLGIDLAKRSVPIYPRILWQGEADGYRCEKLFFWSEQDVVVTAILLHPYGEVVQTDIVLLENGTNEMSLQQERLQVLLNANHRLLILDVRGTGGVQTRSVNDHLPPHDTEYKLGSDAMMLYRSTLGMRVFDVLRAYDYLRSRADVTTIGIVGVDSGAFFAYFAAALEPDIAAVVVENLLFSYRNLAFTQFYDRERYNLRVMAWGILQHFDLVDLLPCFAQRDLTLIGLRDAKGELQAREGFLAVAREYNYLPRGWLPRFV
ncbi:MAG: acetylxylan esterase [Caldilineaceae bacterium]|nr:acetylxylan esterase [Caldilineaceae bacterium]